MAALLLDFDIYEEGNRRSPLNLGHACSICSSPSAQQHAREILSCLTTAMDEQRPVRHRVPPPETSSGWPTRRIGVADTTLRLYPSSARTWLASSVAMYHGHTALARIPWCPHSQARFLTNWHMAAATTRPHSGRRHSKSMQASTMRMLPPNVTRSASIQNRLQSWKHCGVLCA